LSVWEFAAGFVGITILALLLTQLDKVLLSRLLSLGDFGYYAMASVVANALYMLTAPVTTAFYPRFTQLVSRGDEVALRSSYHEATQIVAVLTGTVAAMLIAFGDKAILIWTGDLELTRHVAPIMQILVLGNLISSMIWVAYYMQLAHGWTALTIKVNIVAVASLIPALFWAVPKYGALGAAWIWVVLNTGYLIFDIFFMHRRVLRTEKWIWYRQDVLIPLTSAFGTAAFCRWMFNGDFGKIAMILGIVASAGVVLIVTALSARCFRLEALRVFKHFRN
jgi:O-antigen/teichoic acid export membrane protein